LLSCLRRSSFAVYISAFRGGCCWSGAAVAQPREFAYLSVDPFFLLFKPGDCRCDYFRRESSGHVNVCLDPVTLDAVPVSVSKPVVDR